MNKRILALFDVDQTLTIARSEISKNMKETLKAMTNKGIHFGIVSGSDLPKITEQLNEEIVKNAHWCFAQNGLQAFKNGTKFSEQSFESHIGKQ